MGVRNPVKKHMHKADCYGKIEPSKHKQLKDLAQLKVELEDASEAKIDGKYLNINEEEE